MHENFEAMTVLSALGKFPRLYQRIELIWGTDVCRDYLHELIAGDNSRGRPMSEIQCFPMEVLTALIELLALHDDEYPQFRPIKTVFDDLR